MHNYYKVTLVGNDGYVRTLDKVRGENIADAIMRAYQACEGDTIEQIIRVAAEVQL